LIVPGFSRRYYNLPEFAAALYKEKDNDAGHRLLRHIRERSFDVFVCRDADRFGREQSLVSEVIARIIDSGARIYTLNEGWIDAQHYRMVSALTGVRAASYVDDLSEQRLASPSIMDHYRRQIAALADRRDDAARELDTLAADAQTTAASVQAQRATVAQLRSMTLDAFWNQPDREINRMLHDMFSARKLAARGPDIYVSPRN
jgi:DNA invertase Pin-like site-specific DNA recombinase